MFQRPIYATLRRRIAETKRGHIQVLSGPRQVGKTTLAQQLIASGEFYTHYASADAPSTYSNVWIEQQWDLVRQQAALSPNQQFILILDEIQKIAHWPEVIKKRWDQDTVSGTNIKVLLLGSATLQIQQGLSDSLAGRFELIPITHWSFAECQEAFGWSIEQYIYFGGYPGAAQYIDDEERWQRYILDALIDTTISRDIIEMARVHKPALLRQVFELGCHYSSQILSYQKMLGQLHDAGNTTTMAHYLELLAGVGMVAGLEKFANGVIRQKAASRKLNVLNTALMSAHTTLSFASAQADREYWGRLVKSAVGAHLINMTRGTSISVTYWREGNKEVDFVLTKGKAIVAIEVKSGKQPTASAGMTAFNERFKPQTKLLIGNGGIALDEFLRTSPASWFPQ